MTVISLLLLGAHALRAGDIGGVCFWLLGIGLAVSPWSWTYSALAGLLGFGALIWAGITVELAHQRLALDLPWLRLAIILGLALILGRSGMAAAHAALLAAVFLTVAVSLHALFLGVARL